ncbi:YfcC family protein [Aerococcus vaginalis]
MIRTNRSINNRKASKNFYKRRSAGCTTVSTSFGFAEEIIALFPILMPFFLTAGYDVMTCIATVYLDSMIGTMYSTINPFSVGIASNAAGISLNEGLGIRSIALLLGVIISIIYVLRYAKKVKEDPSNSICYDQYEEHQAEFQQDDPANLEFTRPMKLTLLTFAITFLILIWGLVMYQWLFDTMTALFLASSIVMIFVSGRGIDAYVSGAADMLSVALVIGVACGVNIVLEQGMASDTILYFFSNIVNNMNPILFIVFMLLIFIVLGFFISSSSGLAMLSIPIMAPLAAPVGVSTAAIISAYNFGQGLIAFIAPTGLILASLAMVNITYDRWVKFIWPLMGMIGALNLGMLMVQVLIG